MAQKIERHNAPVTGRIPGFWRILKFKKDWIRFNKFQVWTYVQTWILLFRVFDDDDDDDDDVQWFNVHLKADWKPA